MVKKIDSIDQENLKCAKKLQSDCFKFILFMIDSISSSNKNLKLFENKNESLLENLKLFVTYNQENLIGLLASAIKMSNRTLTESKLNEKNESINDFDLDMSEIFQELISSSNHSNESSGNDTKKFLNIYNLINFILKVLISRESYLLDETVVSMIINIFKVLLLNSDTNKVDIIVMHVVNNLKNEFDYLKSILDDFKNCENNNDNCLILEIILHWINQSIQIGEIGYVTLYVDLISSLNKNSKWKPKVIKFIELIFDSITSSFLDSNNLEQNNTPGRQEKLFNFIYAFNSAPVSNGIGQWIEFKNDNRSDGCTGLNGLPKSSLDFKIGLLKSLFYDGSSNSFNVWAVDPGSRKLINFKELKYNSDFRKTNEKSLIKNETDLYLNKNLVNKLIKLFKIILSKYKHDKPDLFESETTTATANSSTSNSESSSSSISSPIKQKMQKYEQMHIERKKEVNQIFQQHLPLKNNLLILSIITFIKDYILRKTLSEQDSTETKLKDNLDSDSESESQNISANKTNTDDEFYELDIDLLNWIAKLSFSNTNINAYWNVSHLRCFLVNLLLREGFGEIHNEIEIDLIKKTTTIMPETNITINRPLTNRLTKSDLIKTTNENSIKTPATGTQMEFQTNDYFNDSKRVSLKDGEQSIDDLKLNFISLAVLGVCDPSPSSFSLDEMTSSSSIDITSKSNECLSELRNKRSLKLFEDCIDKLFKFEVTSPSSLSSSSHLNHPIDGNKNKFQLSKFDSSSSAFNSNKPTWLNELTSHMSKYINSHATSAITNQLANSKQNDIGLFQTSATAPPSTTNNHNNNNNINSIKLAIASKSVNNFIQPIRNAIKLVSNATIVMTSRELLILFINWSFKHSKQDKKLSIMQINCETEFELLQLLDILYYTDNSVNYRLFVRNVLSSLNIQNENKSNINRSKILNKISLMACHFMLPEYKLMRKINWNSDDHSENDSGKIKNKTNNEPIYEENISFSSMNNFISKQAIDIENGANLTSKPDDIEKLSSTDSNLFIIFDTNKTSQSSSPTKTTLYSNSKYKYNKMIKSFIKQQPQQQQQQLVKKSSTSFAKYNTRDDFETNTKLEFKSDDSDNESTDSLIDSKLIRNKKSITSARGGVGGCIKRSNDCNIEEDETSKNQTDATSGQEDDIEDKSDYQLSASSKSKIKKKKKEAAKTKCRLYFQGIYLFICHSKSHFFEFSFMNCS